MTVYLSYELNSGILYARLAVVKDIYTNIFVNLICSTCNIFPAKATIMGTDALFENYTVEEIQEIEKKTRYDALDKIHVDRLCGIGN